MVHLFCTIAAAFLRAPRPRKPPSSSRRARLGLEPLEGRALPSVSPILSVAQVQMSQAAYHPIVVDVANLQGYSFYLISSNGKPAHDLVIQTEAYNPNGSATITGTWTGENPAGSGNPNPITGTLSFAANGSLVLSFLWTNGQGSQNSFTGTITTVQTTPASAATPYGIHYYLEGTVTSPTPGDGPGQVSGYGSLPFPMALNAD
jgi:hypothetical protein